MSYFNGLKIVEINQRIILQIKILLLSLHIEIKQIKIVDMKAIIYSRVSSLGDRQNTASQISELSEVAKQKGWEVVKTFSERISGAVKNEKRNVLNDCFEYAKNNNIDIILFSEMSRLGRSILQVQASIKWFADNKINAYFKNADITLLNENGEITPYMIIVLDCINLTNQLERENIKYRLNRGRELAKENGVKMGRKVGYRMTPEDYQKKYGLAISLIRKGYKLNEVQSICKSKSLNVGLSTLSTLKKMFK